MGFDAQAVQFQMHRSCQPGAMSLTWTPAAQTFQTGRALKVQMKLRAAARQVNIAGCCKPQRKLCTCLSATLTHHKACHGLSWPSHQHRSASDAASPSEQLGKGTVHAELICSKAPMCFSLDRTSCFEVSLLAPQVLTRLAPPYVVW